jgi:hypothetical protein
MPYLREKAEWSKTFLSGLQQFKNLN